LGEDVEASDVYEVCVAVDGVNSISLGTFYIRGDSGAWTNDTVAISSNEYAIKGTISWLTAS